MFRSLGSVLCVVVMAAFVFGCGGGGGGTPPPPDPPVVVDPEPTDAERITELQQQVLTILSAARTRATGASSATSVLGTNPDATADERARASNHNTAAQAALADIVSANTAAQAATTLAAAQAALADAQTAQNTLNTEATAISSIESTVRMVTNAREEREANQLALTNNSSLIQHVRDNKLVSDAILAALVTAEASATPDSPLTVGQVDATNLAVYPKDTGTGADRVVGDRGVEIQDIPSNSRTPTLTGPSTLRYGFDLKNADGTLLINAYTDITKERANVRRRTAILADDTGTPNTDERYETVDIADTDYLVAGIWVQNNNSIEAFAYGSQVIPTSAQNFCAGIENVSDASGGTRSRTCADTQNLHLITGFVPLDKDMTATYRGDANGAYLAGGDSSYFTGDVTLTAEFVNAAGTGSGSIEGEVTNIVAGGQSMAGSIELQKHTFGDDISATWGGASPFLPAVGVVEGNAYEGNWKGQFFGVRYRRTSRVETVTTNDPQSTEITTYTAQAPGSVAGTFYATQQNNPAGDTAFIGAFGAHR